MHVFDPIRDRRHFLSLLLLVGIALPGIGRAAEPAVATAQTGTADAAVSLPTQTAPVLRSNPTATTPSVVTAPVMPPSGSRTEPGIIEKGQVLTLSQCVDIALRRNPNIVAAANTVDVNRSRVGEARSGYYPQISATAGYVKTQPVPDTSVTGNLVNRSYQYSGSVTLSQNFLDFRTSPSVDAAKYNLAASSSDLSTAEISTVLTVKQAYYGVLQAKRNRDVAADVIKQFQLHLDQARGFYDVGTKARIDVIKAEVDLSNAKLILINTENQLKIAWVNLNNAMGVPDASEYSIEDNLSFQPYTITLEEATNKAFENRPDLKSAVAKRQAAESNVSVARSGYFPNLAGSASYNKGGLNTHANDLGEGWAVGVTVTMPLFNGFLTNHQVAEAKSSLYVLRANEETVRQQVLLDVRQAFLNLQAAEASITTSELAAGQARENLDLANGRYAAGVGSPVEVSDAFATYLTAEANYTSALANYKIAQASIQRAMGMQ